MAGDDRNREQEEEPRVIISDKRHSRDEEEEAADEGQEQAAAAEPELEVVEPAKKAGASVDEEKEDSPPPPPPGAEAQSPAAAAPEDAAAGAAEMDQLKLIFEAGISSYLAGQVSMLINFALIYLGRAANPATGLVAVDARKAKTAIDSLEFIGSQIKEELPEAEQKQLAGIIADLKFNFMQAATGGSDPTPPPGNGN